MPLVSARGATTCPANEPEAVSTATRELLTALGRANPALTPESTLAAFFTVTPDLNSAFPAAAARSLGFTGAALLGAQEADVPGAPARCVRVLVLFETDDTGRPTRARHGVPVYLGQAAVLRPDLTSAAVQTDREGGRR